MKTTLLCGDALEVLRTLPDNFASCCVTSPPYLGLRDYLVSGQIGQEVLPEEYVANLVAVFREVRRVLHDSGTCWIVMGDAYCGGGRTGKGGKQIWGGMEKSQSGRGLAYGQPTGKLPGIKTKDMLGLPWMLAFALRTDGWYLRRDIIWTKENCMPSSVKDRPTCNHETIFLLSKKPNYFYDYVAGLEDAVSASAHDVTGQGYAAPGQSPQKGSRPRGGKSAFRGQGHQRSTPSGPANRSGRDMQTVGPGIIRLAASGNKERRFGEDAGRPGSHLGRSVPWEGFKRNRRTVWSVPTVPFNGKKFGAQDHFAVFPLRLIEPMIQIATSEYGICSQCGTPWEREYRKKTVFLSGSGKAGKAPVGKHAGSEQVQSGEYDVRMGAYMAYETTCWKPTCACEAPPVPAVEPRKGKDAPRHIPMAGLLPNFDLTNEKLPVRLTPVEEE